MHEHQHGERQPPTQFARMFRARRCIICSQAVPQGAGVVDLYNGVISHQGACAAVFEDLRRDRSRSTKGRKLKRDEFRRRVKAYLQEASRPTHDPE